MMKEEEEEEMADGEESRVGLIQWRKKKNLMLWGGTTHTKLIQNDGETREQNLREPQSPGLK